MPDKKKKGALARLGEAVTEKVGDAAEAALGRAASISPKMDYKQGKAGARKLLGRKPRIDMSK